MNICEEKFYNELRFSMCKHMRKYLSDACVEHVLRCVFEDMEPYIKSDSVLWQVMRSALPQTDSRRPLGRHSFALESRTSLRLANIDARLNGHEPDCTFRSPCSAEALHQQAKQQEFQSARQADCQPLGTTFPSSGAASWSGSRTGIESEKACLDNAQGESPQRCVR